MKMNELSPPKTAAELRDLLAQSIMDVRAGRLDPKVANAISNLGASFLHSVQIAELEARITALENQETATLRAQQDSECEPEANTYDVLRARNLLPDLD